jgi:hypothetical protein
MGELLGSLQTVSDRTIGVSTALEFLQHYFA